MASAGQLNLVPILQISGQYSDNVFLQSTDKRSDTSYIINPGIGLDYASSNFVGSFAYQLGVQRHSEFSTRDNEVHRLDASLGFALSSGWYLNATDNLFITSDPLAFDASGDRVQRDSFTYNRFVPELTYEFKGNKMRATARYDRVDIDYDHLTDSIQNGFGFEVGGKLGDRSTMNFNYFEFDRQFDRQDIRFNTVNYTGRRFGVRLDRAFTKRFSGTTFVGYEERDFELEPDRLNFDSVVFDAKLTGEFPEVFAWTIGYSQHLNDLAIRGVYKVKKLHGDIRKSIRDRLHLEFSSFFQYGENEKIPENVDFYGVRVEGQYMFAKFLNAWLGYEYLERDSAELKGFTENRVNFGLTLSYGL